MKKRLLLPLLLSLVTVGCVRGTFGAHRQKNVIDVGTIELATAKPTPAPNESDVVFFDFDSSSLTEAAKQELDRTVQWLEQNPGASLSIQGFTDRKGSAEYNYRLGLKRAEAVRDYLQTKGIEQRRVDIQSYGERDAGDGLDALQRRALIVASPEQS